MFAIQGSGRHLRTSVPVMVCDICDAKKDICVRILFLIEYLLRVILYLLLFYLILLYDITFNTLTLESFVEHDMVSIDFGTFRFDTYSFLMIY